MFKDGLCEMEVSLTLFECKICWVILVWSCEDTVWHKPVSPNFGQTVVFRFHFRELDLLANSMSFQIGGDYQTVDPRLFLWGIVAFLFAN